MSSSHFPLATMTNNTPSPTAFISYSWDSNDHKKWVHNLALRLRNDGIEVILDQWHLTPGDQLPEFMERAVRDCEFVLVVCTQKYKIRSDRREGGVGYEGDIMTAEVLNLRNQRKFIPILREGTWIGSAPSWLSGKYYIDLSGNSYSESQYTDLLTTMMGTRTVAPPVGQEKLFNSAKPASSAVGTKNRVQDFIPIVITGVIVDEVGKPRNDGTRGSALYRVPFKLSERPDREWVGLFIEAWNSPPRSTTMHRPGIASIFGNTIVLNGTTVEEVEDYHRETLILATEVANRKYRILIEKRRAEEQLRETTATEHKRKVDDIVGRISFKNEEHNH